MRLILSAVTDAAEPAVLGRLALAQPHVHQPDDPAPARTTSYVLVAGATTSYDVLQLRPSLSTAEGSGRSL